jgi:hypothetical protein
MDAGARIGRFVIVRDVDGRLHALAPHAVAAICDDGEGGAILLLPGGRALRLDQPVEAIAAWLSEPARP